MIYNQSKAVLTIATGKLIYIQMAVNLARSFKWWHKNSSIKFVLATDQKHLLPEDLLDIEIIELQPGEYGYGFSPKLYLDKLAPAKHTLFIDADCLCVNSLDSVFERFAGHAVSVVGGTISQGEWFGDVARVCQRFKVAVLPKFNGGVYYLEKGELSDRVYSTARELEPQYDEIGLVRLRNRPNDELLMAIAMALHNQTPIPDDGSIMSDPQACPGALFIDVLRGKSRLLNPPAPHPKHQAWYPFTEVNPVIVHFLGDYTTKYPYKREEFKLLLAGSEGWPIRAADLWATVFRTIPLLSIQILKNTLRPAYRKLFGTRRIAVSERL
ncbi:hypothetical protein F7734_17260 [Scytonema sp. UIC 10036]|uniref:hypothetical protein n=1 Tax=Scytonema sp. UIC 10036 TaxID=2304196 RepID=UPI0012DA295D|nr:hypothetical protein [Scytonema sp. UIC 10036]MUG94043.1 hypothetical protein [Scytonema sp. UIC 10036]